MAELTKDIQERMNNIASRYASELRAAIRVELNKAKNQSSGALAGSVKVSVKRADGYNPPLITVDYFEYGEFIGKRKLLWTKLPLVDKIREWVHRKGLAGFGNVPGYTNGASGLSDFKKAERIAWAIAKEKRKNDTFKRHPWKKESLPSVLKKMNIETMTSFADHIEHLFKLSLEKGI